MQPRRTDMTDLMWVSLLAVSPLNIFLSALLGNFCSETTQYFCQNMTMHHNVVLKFALLFFKIKQQIIFHKILATSRCPISPGEVLPIYVVSLHVCWKPCWKRLSIASRGYCCARKFEFLLLIYLSLNWSLHVNIVLGRSCRYGWRNSQKCSQLGFMGNEFFLFFWGNVNKSYNRAKSSVPISVKYGTYGNSA